jgi:membrane-bound lytic murein transglycosylase D
VTSARERIEAIAARFRTTPEVIREVNHIPPKMVLKAGSTILVPKSEEHETDISAEVADSAVVAMEPDVPPTRRIHVKVGKRDTLASIAARHRVSVAQIRSWNNLSRDSVARGQTLELNVPNRVASAARKVESRQLAHVKSHGIRTRVAAAHVRTVTPKAGKTRESRAIVASAKQIRIR